MTQTIASYSLPPSQRLYLIGLGVLLGLLQLINDNPAVGVLVFVLFIGAFFAQARFRTNVREDGVEAVGNITGSKFVAWSDIAEVEDNRVLGTHSIRLIRRDGTKLRLPAPVDGPMFPDHEFGAKLQLVSGEWQRRDAASAPDGAAGVDPQ